MDRSAAPVEEEERAHRSLQRRIRQARLGHFKTMADFDWAWPKRIDRGAVEELMSLAFLADATNIVFVGPNGVGKSTLAQNVAYQALIQGHTVLFKPPARCSANSPPSIAMPLCADACATTPLPTFW